MKRILLLSLLFAPEPVVAEEEGRTRFARPDCELLVRHAPAADTDFRPGRDVRGKPVVPADLDTGPPLRIPERLEIPIDVVHAERPRRPGALGQYEGRIGIGRVTVAADGRVWFDGQPLFDGSRADLVAICREDHLLPGKPDR